MNEPITVTTTVAAWLQNSEYSGRPQDLMSALERGDSVAVVNMLILYGSPSKEKFSDYIRVGEADVTVRLIPRDEQTRMAVAALSVQLEKLRAAYLTRQQEIMEQISKLQAISYDVEAA